MHTFYSNLSLTRKCCNIHLSLIIDPIYNKSHIHYRYYSNNSECSLDLLASNIELAYNHIPDIFHAAREMVLLFLILILTYGDFEERAPFPFAAFFCLRYSCNKQKKVC